MPYDLKMLHISILRPLRLIPTQTTHPYASILRFSSVSKPILLFILTSDCLKKSKNSTVPSVIALPIYSSLSKDDIMDICETVINVINEIKQENNDLKELSKKFLKSAKISLVSGTYFILDSDK